jgi:hypothetical protein
VDLDEAADELYALAPSDFTARRSGLAAQARRDGAADVAKQIAELRKPTTSAGLVNRLIRGGPEDGDDVGRLEDLGTRLREAQARLDGTQMRELTRSRHEIVAALVRRAGDLVAGDGQKLSASVQRELEETFGAAVADEQAARAVLSGRLTRALVYAGLGEVDVTAATATPLGRVTPARARPSSARGKQPQPAASPDPEAEAQAARAARAAARARVVEAVDAARADLTSAERELAASTEEQAAAIAEESRLSARLTELQEAIIRTRHELDVVERRVAGAERERQRQERRLSEARSAVQKAEKALIDE